MTQLSSARKRLVALAVLVPLAGGACVRPDPPGVAITKVEASLVFGVKPPPEPVQPAIAPIAPAFVEQSAPEPEIEIDVQDFVAPPSSDFNLEVEPPKSDCPLASPTAVAERAADIFVTAPIDVGLYRWKVEASANGQSASAFQKRAVRNVRKENDTTYTYEVVAPTLGKSTTTITTYRVDTNPVYRDTTPGGGTVFTGPRVGEPERGVVLVREVEVDAQGNTLREFSPPVGMLLLPLEVRQGERIQSAGVDRRSGQTRVLDVTVQRRARIDACGSVVDGWLVEGTLTDTSLGQGILYSYVIATQYGGIPIQETFRIGEGAEASSVSFTQAQVTPDPLPAGL